MAQLLKGGLVRGHDKPMPGKPSALFSRQNLLVLGVKLPKKIGHLAFQVHGSCAIYFFPWQKWGRIVVLMLLNPIFRVCDFNVVLTPLKFNTNTQNGYISKDGTNQRFHQDYPAHQWLASLQAHWTWRPHLSSTHFEKRDVRWKHHINLLL